MFEDHIVKNIIQSGNGVVLPCGGILNISNEYIDICVTCGKVLDDISDDCQLLFDADSMQIHLGGYTDSFIMCSLIK